MRQGQTSPKRPTDADRHCLAAVQNFTQVAVFHSSFTVLHFLILFPRGGKPIPDICHEPHEHVRVNFFWPV